MRNPCLGWEPRWGGGNHRQFSQAGLSLNLILHESLNIHLPHRRGEVQEKGPNFSIRQPEFNPVPAPTSWVGFAKYLNPSESPLLSCKALWACCTGQRESDWHTAGGCYGCSDPFSQQLWLLGTWYHVNSSEVLSWHHLRRFYCPTMSTSNSQVQTQFREIEFHNNITS